MNGKKNGFGKYSYASGDKFEGEYINDKKHGVGLYTFKSGASYSGTYANG